MCFQYAELETILGDVERARAVFELAVGQTLLDMPEVFLTLYTLKLLLLKYYLKHEHECFIRYKTRGAAERFRSDKARIARVLNSFKNDPFYTHLVTLFTKEF